VLVPAVVVLLGIAFALAYGAELGTGNQNTYLLDPLVRASPELYRSDWFVTENHHYHYGFAVVTAPLFSLDPAGAWAFGVAQLIVAVATLTAIYGIVAALLSRGRLVVFAGICGLVLVGGDRTLGGGYLYAGYLQPSSFAVLAWLLAVNAWIRERPLLAGIALGVGALFHINYALLGIGVFGACELLRGPRDLRRLAYLVGPSLLVVLAFLPTMLASSKTDDDALALRILVQFLFPGHFKPYHLRLELASLLGWFVLLLAFRPDERSGASERVFRFAAVTMGVSILAVAVVQVPPLLTLTRLFVWRIAPFGVVCAQILLLIEVGKIAAGTRARPRGLRLVAILVAAAAIAYNAFIRRRGPIYAEVVTCVLVVSGLAILVRRERIVTALCAALCVFALWLGRAALVSPRLFTTTETTATRWARKSSARDALFLVPPYQSRFRLSARRAVVIDIKSPPMYLDEVVDWYRRLCDVVDAQSLESIPATNARWDALRPEQLLAIATKFHATYVVLDKGRSRARLTLPVAFEDDVNVIYAMPAVP
jgi:hypothetical protein